VRRLRIDARDGAMVGMREEGPWAGGCAMGKKKPPP